MATARDIPLIVSSPSTGVRGERRITPSWSIAQLKTKLEPVTGVSPDAQKLVLKMAGRGDVEIRADKERGEREEDVQVGKWVLSGMGGGMGEIEVHSTLPLPSSTASYLTTSPSTVEKYTLPPSEYEKRTDSVLAWKKAQHLGRFDPQAPAIEQQKVEGMWALVKERGIEAGKRAQLGEDSSRRGVVRYVGEVGELPGGLGKRGKEGGGPWVGVELDEPGGRNDGSVAVPKKAEGGGKEGGGEEDEDEAGDGDRGGREGVEGGRKRYFSCGENRGVFVRPERVFVGEEFVPLGLEEEDEDMEEI